MHACPHDQVLVHNAFIWPALVVYGMLELPTNIEVLSLSLSLSPSLWGTFNPDCLHPFIVELAVDMMIPRMFMCVFMHSASLGHLCGWCGY